jgi:tetratricopeptide (TPR) repeat protein/mono/diheme cytochrome c family protein
VRRLLRAPLLVALVAGCADAGAGGPAEPTFSGGVAQVIHRSCAGCHHPGGAGPFPLLTYEQVREHARRIARVTEARVMPPWPPSRPVGVFVDERRLADDEIALIRRWVEDGAPLGDPAAVPPPPAFSDDWSLGAPDLVVEMEESYVVPADAEEIFRNFVLPVPNRTPRWIRAVDLKPGGPHVVHHATLAVDRTASSRALDGRDPGPGFDGMGSAGGAEHPGGVFIGWTPGKSTVEGADGLSWALEPGSDLVARLHLRPIDEPVEVRTRVGLYYADGPPERRPVALHLGTQAIDIPPGEADYEVRDSLTVPVDVDVLSVYPHAHYLGKVVQAWAETPEGARTWLVEIPDWDFNWQDEYRFREPVRLPAGSTIHMRYTYDNTAANPRNPSDPPVRVTYGPRSVDEMADLVVQTVPATADGSATLAQMADLKISEIKLEGFRAALDEGREDATLRYNMGIAEASRGRLDEAETQFRRATALDPEFADAFINLGIVLHRQGRVPDALTAYLRAADLAPGEARAQHNAGVALEELGRLDEAEVRLRAAVERDSTFALSYKRLGSIFERRGDLPGALASYRRAVEHDPADAETRLWLGRALAASGDGVAALEHLRAAAELAPGAPQPLLVMADMLAGYPDVAVRQPAEAVRLARQAVEITRRRDPVALLSLANAFASAGDLRQAVATGEEALAVARQSGPGGLAQAIEARVARWRQGGR